MRRAFLALGATAATVVLLTASAAAHTVTSANLACRSLGHPALAVNYTNFTPLSNGTRAAITATFTNGATEEFTPPNDQGALTEPAPLVANGTPLGVTMTWSDGTTNYSYTVPSVPQNCTPPAPTSPVTPPTPPQPTLPTPASSPTPTPPTRPQIHKHHRAKCAGISANLIRAAIRPQALIKGTATLRVVAPKDIKTIVVKVYGQPHRLTWQRTYHGSRVRLELDVTSASIWGRNPHCGCTYDTHAVIEVILAGGCTRATEFLPYNNQDGPPHKRR